MYLFKVNLRILDSRDLKCFYEFEIYIDLLYKRSNFFCICKLLLYSL